MQAANNNHMPMRAALMRARGIRGLGVDPSAINVTTMWLPGTGAGSGWLDVQGDASTAISGPAYVAPSHVPVPACALGDPWVAASADCQAQLMAAQQQNLAADSGANRDYDISVCESNYAQNAAQYRALGMPVPPDDCNYRGYGLTLPGTTGGYSGYMPGTPQEVLDWRAANPGGGVDNPWDAIDVSYSVVDTAPKLLSPGSGVQAPAGGGTAPKTPAGGGQAPAGGGSFNLNDEVLKVGDYSVTGKTIFLGLAGLAAVAFVYSAVSK
jgi:hypothetical protein